jgi:hypothetical protein
METVKESDALQGYFTHRQVHQYPYRKGCLHVNLRFQALSDANDALQDGRAHCMNRSPLEGTRPAPTSHFSVEAKYSGR